MKNTIFMVVVGVVLSACASNERTVSMTFPKDHCGIISKPSSAIVACPHNNGFNVWSFPLDDAKQ